MNTRRNIGIGVGVIAAIAAFIFLSGGEDAVVDTEVSLPVVTTTTAGEFTGQTTVSLIGTVRAFSEAAVTAEQSGRVTSVPVRLGQQVAAGQVIATLENASQRASVLQAEGAYDAAIAAKNSAQVTDSQSVVSVEQAEVAKTNAQNTAVTTLKSAYNTANGIVINNIDEFFTSPGSQVPGLRIGGRANTSELNAMRVQFQTLLPQWQNRANSANTSSDLQAELDYAAQNITQTSAFVTMFIDAFSSQSGSTRYTDAEIRSFGSTFNTLRNNLNNTQIALDNAKTGLVSADDSIRQAQLTTTITSSPAADAQIKQALGSLRAAQANLAKTVLRTPISGTVNELSLRTGDFVSAQQQIAEVANNNALELVTSIGEQERDAFAVGDSVQIEGGLNGTVTEIAPAVNADTGKIEVRIAAESTDLRNGDTVTITRQATTTVDSRVFVPLSAVKFEQTNGDMLVVVDSVLEVRPVTLGIVRGGAVEILSGLSNDQTFVTDARGLQAGTAVEVINN